MPEKVEFKKIRIEIVTHRVTGLLMAFSHDLKGLLVPGRSEEELIAKLPAAITELLEAQGRTVVSADAERDQQLPAEFIASSLVANLSLKAGHA